MANMELSKYIKSESVELNRSAIHLADYKPIDGYNGKYIISTSGDIIRLPYSSNSKYTQWRNNKMFHVKSRTDRNGYVTVRLNINGIEKFKQVHRLVAETFLPKIEGKDFVNHKDGCKQNNKVSNLEWCTKSENTQHAFATGLKKPACGEKHGCAKLKEKDVEEIRVLLAAGNTGISIAKKYGISASAVSSIKRDKAWKIV